MIYDYLVIGHGIGSLWFLETLRLDLESRKNKTKARILWVGENQLAPKASDVPLATVYHQVEKEGVSLWGDFLLQAEEEFYSWATTHFIPITPNYSGIVPVSEDQIKGIQIKKKGRWCLHTSQFQEQLKSRLLSHPLLEITVVEDLVTRVEENVNGIKISFLKTSCPSSFVIGRCVFMSLGAYWEILRPRIEFENLIPKGKILGGGVVMSYLKNFTECFIEKTLEGRKIGCPGVGILEAFESSNDPKYQDFFYTEKKESFRGLRHKLSKNVANFSVMKTPLYGHTFLSLTGLHKSGYLSVWGFTKQLQEILLPN